MASPSESTTGFVAFFRRYTKTWLHALATAALTGFGALAILHRGFVALAVTAYVLPPIVLYLTRSGPLVEREGATSAGGADAMGADEKATSVGGKSMSAGGKAMSAGGIESGARAEPAGDEAEARPGEPTGSDGAATRWTTVTTPTDATLFDATVAGEDAYAVGAGGVVLADGGDGWRTLLADGPGADSNALRGVDATDDGDGVWVAGDGGTVARLDGTTGWHVDVGPPRGRTDAWEGVAVGGAAGDELVLLINGSGEVLRGRYRDGSVAWDAPVKPGSGSSLSGVALATDAVGYVCDTNDGVFETTDGGESFRRIGIGSADGTLTDVATAGGDCTVVDDDGVLHRRDDGTWTRLRLGDEPLEAVAFRDDDGVACGGNVVHERSAGSADWDRTITAVSGPLVGIDAGRDRAVAVGRDGALVERT